MPRGKATKPREVASRFRETFLTDLDGRYPVVRGLKYRLGCYAEALGGMAALSPMELTLIKRAVHVEHLIEQKESTLISGGVVNVNEYLAAINSLSALLSKIGLKRRVKNITLTEFLKNRPESPASPTEASHEPD